MLKAKNMNDGMLGEPLELVVSDLNSDGGAVARHNGQVIFLDTGLPGEHVSAYIIEQKKNYIRAQVACSLIPSTHEVAPFCPSFQECGGCVWQHLEYSTQLQWKKIRVEEQLRRVGKTVFPVSHVWSSPTTTTFRNKISYVFHIDNHDVIRLGLRRRESHTVVPVASCPLQAPEAQGVLEGVTAWANRHSLSVWNGHTGLLRHAVLRQLEGAIGATWGLEIIASRSITTSIMADLWQRMESAHVVSVYFGERATRDLLASSERIVRTYGTQRYGALFGHCCLEYSLPSFRQTNTGAATQLVRIVFDMLNIPVTELADESCPRIGGCLWDVYCGAGGFGLSLAPYFDQVIGFESAGCSIADARHNATLLSRSNCCFIAGNAGVEVPRLMKRLNRKAGEGNAPDIVVVDPPRAGLDTGVLHTLIRHPAQTLVYVSCDPATLARDIAALLEVYALVRVDVIDMFPHTPHVETVVLLRRIRSSSEKMS